MSTKNNTERQIKIFKSWKSLTNKDNLTFNKANEPTSISERIVWLIAYYTLFLPYEITFFFSISKNLHYTNKQIQINLLKV